MFKYLFSPYGRVSRKGIWLFYGAFFVIFGATTAIDMISGLYDEGADLGVFSGIASLALLLPSIAIPIKRFHDRSMTGWWIVIFPSLFGIVLIIGVFLGLAETSKIEHLFQPPMASWVAFRPSAIVAGLVIIYWFVVQMVLPGTRGENKYGPDPLEKN